MITSHRQGVPPFGLGRLDSATNGSFRSYLCLSTLIFSLPGPILVLAFLGHWHFLVRILLFVFRSRGWTTFTPRPNPAVNAFQVALVDVTRATILVFFWPSNAWPL
jgi:hypothetical protein